MSIMSRDYHDYFITQHTGHPYVMFLVIILFMRCHNLHIIPTGISLYFGLSPIYTYFTHLYVIMRVFIYT